MIINNSGVIIIYNNVTINNINIIIISNNIGFIIINNNAIIIIINIVGVNINFRVDRAPSTQWVALVLRTSAITST